MSSQLDRDFLAAVASPDRRGIPDWARENIHLPPVLTRSGRFDVSGSRHFEAPFAAIQSARVREVNIRCSVRSGKTLIVDAAVPWGVCNDAASILWLFQTDPIAREHAETRQWPILLRCPPVAPLLPANRDKQRTQEIIFANGLPLMLRGPALSGLQSRGFKWVICDEPWMYAPGILQEAQARLGDFVKSQSSKFIVIGQAGVESDDWDMQFQSGDLHEWHVPCLGCGRSFTPRWSAFRQDGSRWGVRWETTKDNAGRYDRQQARATLRLECPHCGHEHHDSERTRRLWNDGGHYVCERAITDGTKVSYHWNALIDFPWGDLLDYWLTAREAAHQGNYAPTIAFHQKRLAEPSSERTVHEVDRQFARASVSLEPTARAWDGEVARFLSADRQAEDVYWVMVRAWAKGTGESRRLFYGKAFSGAEIEQIAERFKVPPDCCVVDSGYLPRGDHGVYSLCARNGWFALKGEDKSPFFWHRVTRRQGGVNVTQRIALPWSEMTWADPGEGTAEQGRRRCRLFRFASAHMSDRVADLISRGLWREPAGADADPMDAECRKQMADEVRVVERDEYNRPRPRWKSLSSNNHAFDCAKMQVVCALQAGLWSHGLQVDDGPPQPGPGDSPPEA